jgi:uncharacterized protein (TIGR02246 family)
MPAQNPEQTHALLEAAFNAGDVDAFADVYEEDAALLVPPDGELVVGRDEIRAALAPQFALEQKAARIEVIAKVETDGLALTNAHWRLAGTDADGNAVELAGSGTIVSRRQPDGTWLIVLDRPVRPD